MNTEIHQKYYYLNENMYTFRVFMKERFIANETQLSPYILPLFDAMGDRVHTTNQKQKRLRLTRANIN